MLPSDIRTGAGIYAVTSNEMISSGPIANNGLIVSTDVELRLECVSNSTTSREGNITTPANGNIGVSEMDGFLVLTNPFERPGFLRLRTTMLLNTARQGIYICKIPDSSGNIISINVGLYPRDFNGGFIIIII